MDPLVFAALSLGTVSSLHCVGMCGPLVMALPIRHLSHRSRMFALSSYHAGRLLTYTLLGTVSGMLGRPIYLGGFQQTLSIALGSLILCGVILAKGLPDQPMSRLSPRWTNILLTQKRKLTKPLENLNIRLWKSSFRNIYFFLGMGNGLLPCGMVWLALAVALGLPTVSESMLFMFLFGAGTLPALALVHISGSLIGLSARKSMRKAIPFLIGATGILLILRGLNLGIPYISPVSATPGHAISCH